MAMHQWQKIKSTQVHKNPWFKVYEDDVLRPDGSRGKYFYFGKNMGVVIVPFDGKKIYLVNQYRYTLKKRCWELPAGKSESKNYLVEAKKELAEETGFRAKQWHYLGKFDCGPGHTSHQGRVYLARDLVKGNHQREAGESDMLVKSFSLRQLDQMIKKGELTDSWLIVSLYFFKQYLDKRRKAL